MKMSIWRPALKTFLAKYITISGYGVAEPDTYGVFLAHLPPLTEVTYTRSPPDICQGQAIQNIFILARYPGTQTFNDLPIASLEGLYCSLVMHFELENGKLVDPLHPGIPLLQQCTTTKIDEPVKVHEVSYANQDWVIEIHLGIRIVWNAEPEIPIDTILLEGLNLEIYRSTLKSLSDASLDGVLSL
jgi:hypothetical protein